MSALAKAADHPFTPASNGPDIAARANLLENINERSLEMAKKAVSFIRESLWDSQTNTLFRSYREGRGPQAQADDYAFLIQSLLDLYESTADEQYLHWALQLQRRQG